MKKIWSEKMCQIKNKMEKKEGRQEVTKRARTSVNAHTTVPVDEMVKKLKSVFLLK